MRRSSESVLCASGMRREWDSSFARSRKLRDENFPSLSKQTIQPLRPADESPVMSNYCYEAVNAGGFKMEGQLDVSDQSEALRRIKEMGLFPVKIWQARAQRRMVAKKKKSL